MSMIQFDITSYVNIRQSIRLDPEFTRKYLRMWLDIADALLEVGTAKIIQETAEQLKLRPQDVMVGIIQGCLNEQFVNEGLAPILGKEILPLAILTLKDVTLEGDERYADWRRWFQLDQRDVIDANTIAKVIGNIMKYARFLDFDKLSEALESNQLITFKGLGSEQVKLLPFVPALRYQQQIHGDLRVGTFFTDPKAGFFNCGDIDTHESDCLACGRNDLRKTKDGKYMYCRACNAGYKIKREVSSDDRKV